MAGLLVAGLALAGVAYWQRGIAVRERNVAESQRIATLAELATSERLRGNLDTALRLGVHAARLVLASDRVGAEMFAPRTALAIAVCQSDWRLMLGGNKDAVYSAGFSPDGKRIVTVSAGDNTARIWDAATGKEIMVLRGHEGPVTSAAFSPDGLRIVTASMDKTARIWDAATGKELTVLRGHEGRVTSATFSPDGLRIVTASMDKTARIWDAPTGKELTVLRGLSIGVRSGPQIGIQGGPPRFAFRTISVRPVGAGRGCGDGASAG